MVQLEAGAQQEVMEAEDTLVEETPKEALSS